MLKLTRHEWEVMKEIKERCLDSGSCFDCPFLTDYLDKPYECLLDDEPRYWGFPNKDSERYKKGVKENKISNHNESNKKKMFKLTKHEFEILQGIKEKCRKGGSCDVCEFNARKMGKVEYCVLNGEPPYWFIPEEDSEVYKKCVESENISKKQPVIPASVIALNKWLVEHGYPPSKWDNSKVGQTIVGFVSEPKDKKKIEE